MELVSANTKNYLFLTLTQNNESDALVRARVSMRRDQAFWEGGNSFIACESFRITSAPNAGGLYYQEVPADFVISCVSNGTTHPADSTWVEQLGFAPPGVYNGSAVPPVPARPADRLIAKQVFVTHSSGNLPDYYHVQLGIARQNGQSIGESKFSDLAPRIVRYISNNRLGINQKIRLVNANGATAEVGVMDDAVLSITGPGGGPDGMFLPLMEFLDPNAAFARFGVHNYSAGCKCRFKSLNYAGTLGAGPMQEIRNMVGKGAYLHPHGMKPTVNVPNAQALFDAALYRVMAPDGLLTDIVGAKTGDHYNFPIQWDTTQPLKVGDTVYQIIDAHGTKKSGKVTNVGSVPTSTPAGMTWLLDIKITQAAQGDPAVSALNMTYPQTFELALTQGPMSANYEAVAAGPVIATTDSADGNHTHYVPGPSASVLLANNGVNHTRTITRGRQSKLVYTPNEFYNIFNQVGNDLVGAKLVPPWLLQTDENGGFCVKWDMTGNTASSFSISKAMCDSLGLNPYMEYDWIRPNPKNKYTATLIDKKYTDASLEVTQEFGSALLDRDVQGLYRVADNSPVDPTTDVNGIRQWTFGDEVTFYQTDKTYLLIDIQHFDEASGESVGRTVIPNLVEENGIEMYVYTRLPTIGEIRNNGQVSVESWGTFSMINLVIPNIPFQSMLGGESDSRILASLRLPFQYSTENNNSGSVSSTGFSYYGDLLFNSDSSRSYLRITTDQQLFDCDVEARLIRRDGSMEVMQIPYKGQFQVKLRLLQTQ